MTSTLNNHASRLEELPLDAPYSAALRADYHVLLDEAFHPNTAVCAVILSRSEFLEANERMHRLRDASQENTYLRGFESFDAFDAKGFHSTTDTLEVSIPAIQEIFQSIPGRVMIFYSDGTARPKISEKKRVLLLYCTMAQLILRKLKHANGVCFHFERHEELEKYFSAVTKIAKRRSRSNADIATLSCPKGDFTRSPEALPLPDYFLRLFGRAKPFLEDENRPMEKVDFRNALAIKGNISLIYSIEKKRIASREVPW